MTQNMFEQVVGADILIVDDTPDNIRFLSSLLAKKGYKVRKALNGQMALIAAKTLTPDLILLDINMPEMDGYEVCRRLKADEVTCSIPVIFLSAWDAPEDKVKAFQAGGIDYITKPFQFAEVLMRIENQLTLRNLQKQLQVQNSQLKQAIAIMNHSHLELIHQETASYLSRLAIGMAHGLGQPLTQLSNYLSVIQQALPTLKQRLLASQGESAAGELPDRFPNRFPDQFPDQFPNQATVGAIDATSVLSSLDRVTQGMQTNANCMQAILLALHSLAKCNTAELRSIDIHQAIDRMLLLLQPFFMEPGAAQTPGLVKDYGVLPSVTCYVNLFDQVLFSLLSQAIDGLTFRSSQVETGAFQPTLRIKTELSDRETVLIHIQDNSTQDNGTAAPARSSESLNSLPPAFLDQPDRPSGELSGLPIGILICQQIVEETHQGRFTHRTSKHGSEFIVEMPVQFRVYGKDEG